MSTITELSDMCHGIQTDYSMIKSVYDNARSSMNVNFAQSDSSPESISYLPPDTEKTSTGFIFLWALSGASLVPM